MRSITLFIPGLLGPDIPVHPDDLPDIPALNWLFGRGEHQSLFPISPSYSLCELFGLKQDNISDIPIAAISRLSDDNQHPEGIWMRVDPIHVSPDRDGLILMDNNRFNLSQHDALALAAEVNKVLEPHGLILEVPVPYRWYVKLNERYQLQTTPLDLIVGKDILPFMPVGDDRVKWIQLLNEIQMTLHDSEINLMRQQEKKLPINSVWFWGHGELPHMINRHWSLVMSDEMLAKGLAMVAATPFEDLPETYNQVLRRGDSFNDLMVINAFQRFTHYHDLEGWLEALMYYEKNWFAPLRMALKKGSLDYLHIRTNTLSISLDKAVRYKVWKKKKNLLKVREQSL